MRVAPGKLVFGGRTSPRALRGASPVRERKVSDLRDAGGNGGKRAAIMATAAAGIEARNAGLVASTRPAFSDQAEKIRVNVW